MNVNDWQFEAHQGYSSFLSFITFEIQQLHYLTLFNLNITVKGVLLGQFNYCVINTKKTCRNYVCTLPAVEMQSFISNILRRRVACYCSLSLKELIVVSASTSASVSVIVKRFNFLKDLGYCIEFYLGYCFNNSQSFTQALGHCLSHCLGCCLDKGSGTSQKLGA